MSNCYVEEAEVIRYVLHRADGSRIVLEFDEVKAIERYMKNRKWVCEIEDQINKDEDSLDFSGEINKQQFINLCLEEIASKIEIYGEDYEPDIQDIVFDVAEDNDIWRDE